MRCDLRMNWSHSFTSHSAFISSMLQSASSGGCEREIPLSLNLWDVITGETSRYDDQLLSDFTLEFDCSKSSSRFNPEREKLQWSLCTICADQRKLRGWRFTSTTQISFSWRVFRLCQLKKEYLQPGSKNLWSLTTKILKTWQEKSQIRELWEFVDLSWSEFISHFWSFDFFVMFSHFLFVSFYNVILNRYIFWHGFQADISQYGTYGWFYILM